MDKIKWEVYAEWHKNYYIEDTYQQYRYGQAFYNHFSELGYKLKHPHTELFYEPVRQVAINIILEEYIDYS
jgi:galactose-1-phosphate uridylyltransferase